MTRWLLPERERREEKLRRLYGRVMLKRVMGRHGRVFATGGVAGAALWSPPARWKPDVLTLARCLPDVVGVFGRDLSRAAVGLARIEREHPEEPHWYLATLGVEPESQGRGLGSALLGPVLELCDAGAVPAYLESSTPRSRALYERHGFAVVEELVLPRGGPPVWPMWREPRVA